MAHDRAKAPTRLARAAALALLSAAAARGQAPPAPPPAPASTPAPAVPATAPPVPGSGMPAALAPAVAPPSAGEAGGGPAPTERFQSPGAPPPGGRPLPGGAFDPGAAGPGVGRASDELFLGGALDPRTGWPFVFLDHFRPRPDRVERLWVVQTRLCPQVMGSDPWPCMKVLHFDAAGNLVERPASELFAQALARPVVIQTHGSLVTADAAVGELLWTHSWLGVNRALPPNAVFIEFDWPSQRVFQNDVKDINEKARRAYVAGYHLARFVQGFPPGSRICLLGQSYGGRVVPSALHLLGGGSLNSQDHDPPVRLPCTRPDLRPYAILLEGASDHDWLDPDRRLDRALPACAALLNLYNRRDQALLRYPLLKRSGHRRAIGRIGLTDADFERLGPLAARYAEHDVNDLLGREHTLLDAVANAQIARWMAPYLGAPDPGPSPARTYRDAPLLPGRGLRFNLGPLRR